MLLRSNRGGLLTVLIKGRGKGWVHQTCQNSSIDTLIVATLYNPNIIHAFKYHVQGLKVAGIEDEALPERE